MSPAAFLLRLCLAIVLIVNGIGAPPVVAAAPAPAAASEAPPCHGAAVPDPADSAEAARAPAPAPMDCCDERGACACLHACPGLPIVTAAIATAPIHSAAPARLAPHYRFEPASRLHRPPIA